MRIIELNEVDSTNEYIKRNHEVLDDFTFVNAKKQIKGKGRSGRIWRSNENENLTFSIFIKKENITKLGGEISIVISSILVKFLQENFTLNNIEIKWPNDIYINDKKVCGILLESNLPEYLIIGIGLNINQKEFIGEYRKTPTSLSLETKEEIDIEALKNALFIYINNQLNNDYIDINKYFFFYNEHDYLKNKEVYFVLDNNKRKGIVIGIDASYNLLIKSSDKTYSISSGEITLV